MGAMLDEASFLELQVSAVHVRWEELCDVFLVAERSSSRRVGFPRFLLAWLQPERQWPAAGGVLAVACTARYLTAAERVLRGAAGEADRLLVQDTERRAGRFSLRLAAAGMEAAVAACLRTPPPLPPCAVVFAAGRRVLSLPSLVLLPFARLPTPQRLSESALLLPAAPPDAVQRLLTLLQRPGAAAPLTPAQAAPVAELCRRLGGGQLAALLLAPQTPAQSGTSSGLPPAVFSPLASDRKPAVHCVSVRCRSGSSLPTEALLLLRAGVGTSVTLVPSDGVPISAHKLALCLYSPLIRRTFETLATAALDPEEMTVRTAAQGAAPGTSDDSGRTPGRPRAASGDGPTPDRLPSNLGSPNCLTLPTLSAEDLQSMLDYIYGGETPATPSTTLFRRRMCAWIDFDLLPMEIAAPPAPADVGGMIMASSTAAATATTVSWMTGPRRTVKSEGESPSITNTQPRPRKRRKTTPASPAATAPHAIAPLETDLIVYVAEEHVVNVAKEEPPTDVLREPPLVRRGPTAADVFPPSSMEPDPLDVSPLDSSAEDVAAGLATIAPLDADLTITALPGTSTPPPPPPSDVPDDPDYVPAEEETTCRPAQQQPRHRRGRPRRPLNVELTTAAHEPVVKVEPLVVDSPTSTTTARNFTCEHCGKTLRTATSLANHVRTHTGERPFTCAVCGKAFSSLPGVRHHEKTHGDTERDCVCDVCGKRFTRHNLWSHMKTHSKPYLCAVCGQGFSSQLHLKNHSVSQHEPRSAEHVCHECGRTFTQKGHLANHLRLHSDERRKFCTICRRTWPSVEALQDHQALKHGDSGTVQCDQCDKTFRTLSSLRYHRRRHTGERPFKCTFCDKRFVRPDNLQLHMRRHTGERPYECEYCSKKFISKAVLNKHLAAHRESGKQAQSSSPPYHEQQQEQQQQERPQQQQREDQQPHHQIQQSQPSASAEQRPPLAARAVSSRGPRPVKSPGAAAAAVLTVPVSETASGGSDTAATAAAAPPEEEEPVQIETLSVQLPACLLEEAGGGEQTFTVDLQPGEPQFVAYL